MTCLGIFIILKPFEDPLGPSLGVRELGLELNPGFCIGAQLYLPKDLTQWILGLKCVGIGYTPIDIWICG
jgi:hypothetical protein